MMLYEICTYKGSNFLSNDIQWLVIYYFTIKLCLYICSKINKSIWKNLGILIICTKDYMLFLFTDSDSANQKLQNIANIMRV